MSSAAPAHAGPSFYFLASDYRLTVLAAPGVWNTY